PKGKIPMEPFLNEDHPEPAYQCGRLMAMLAALQYRALGDVGAGVVQRYYASASATPALVLGRLVRTAQFHLNKLDRGLARWHEGRIADTWGKIRDRVPRTLDLEQQSLFALGYYQQIAHDRARTRPDAAAENLSNETSEETENV
ncbi:MAG TPA: type I-C CRISPR-associated protein Cas8c/Csd1, partial [Thermoanaerobaculia bacterium]|nr:type I-C CRISPR-associated protein Cas8c/Csd1 [Thermoanaerobaculia bacterium]